MTEPAAGVEVQQVPALTGCRWYAALVVFAFHVHLFMPGWRPGRVAEVGLTGVSFFFVLSGFVLTLGHRPDRPVRRFYKRRFARIWPSHATMWLVALAILGPLGQSFSLNGALQNLVLVEGWVPHHVQFRMDPPSWSLSCEAAFYLSFPVLWWVLHRVSVRQRVGLVALWILGSAIVTFLATGRYDETALYSNPLLRGAEFALGIVLGLEFRRGARLGSGRLVALVLVTLAAVADAFITGLARPGWLLVIPFGAVVLWLASNPQSRLARFLARRENVYLGEVSFAFYLVHQPVVQLLLPRSPGGLVRGGLLAVAALALALVAAVLLHHLVERPAQRRLSEPRRRPQLASP